MGLSTLRNVRFAGMATCVPTRVVDNISDSPPHMRASRERLVRNVGIQKRRVCPDWQCFSDLAYEAAEKLIADLQWSKDEIGALIVVTQSPDYILPATAIILQDRLKLSQTTIAYDVNLGCSGYPFGVHLLGSLISTGAIKKGLVLVGDRPSSYHWPVKDPLFSDAGTATALEYQESAAPMYFDLNSDGSGFEAIKLPFAGHRFPVQPENLASILASLHQDDDGIWRSSADLILDGSAVLSFATQRVPPAVERLLDYAKAGKEDIDYYVFHQANRMINETIRKKLGLPTEKVPSTLQDFGNTSGASLPVTVTARLREALAQGKKRLLMNGFGVGLSWGGVILDIDGAVFPELIEA